MKELLECIKNNTTKDMDKMQKCITNMVCLESEPIPLSSDTLLNALNIEGEFLVLKLHYDDYSDELKTQKIKYKIAQSLSVIVSYEDDGNSFAEIEKFVKYIHDLSDSKQNSIFGVKKVDELSKFPITILFSGILPINQLRMSVGKEINALIHSDDEYFIPRFQKHRDDISKEVGIPILPLFPEFDETLGEYKVRLIDIYDERVISEFEVCKEITKESVDIYLLKLFYIYKVLVEEKKYKNKYI
ncbi:MAG: hypothetical protein U9N33_02535 [Campylobacterota bacterium]|nr:hypothetical protein [Campylobacterota bacterium]